MFFISQREERSGKTQSSSTGLIVILVIMVGLTWGIAATAYFGVVDYKALISEFPLHFVRGRMLPLKNFFDI